MELSKEAGGAGGEVFKIEKSQKIDRLKLPVKRRGCTDLRSERKICRQKLWGPGNWCGIAELGGLRADPLRKRHGSEVFRGEVAVRKHSVQCLTHLGILRGKRAAAKQVAASVVPGIGRDSAPEHRKNRQIPMLLVDARTTEFENFSANCIKGSEIKLLGAIEAAVRCRAGSGLHTVGTHNLGSVLDDEMVACGVVGVFIPEGEERGFESFLEFQIEHEKTKGLRGSDVLWRRSETDFVLTRTRSARQDSAAYDFIFGHFF